MVMCDVSLEDWATFAFENHGQDGPNGVGIAKRIEDQGVLCD